MAAWGGWWRSLGPFLSSFAKSFNKWENWDNKVDELKVVIGSKEEREKLQEEVTTMHSNQGKALKCLQKIVD